MFRLDNMISWNTKFSKTIPKIWFLDATLKMVVNSLLDIDILIHIRSVSWNLSGKTLFTTHFRTVFSPCDFHSEKLTINKSAHFALYVPYMKLMLIDAVIENALNTKAKNEKKKKLFFALRFFPPVACCMHACIFFS